MSRRLKSNIGIIIAALALVQIIRTGPVYGEVTATAEVSQRLVRVGTLFQVIVTVEMDSSQSVQRPDWPPIKGLTLTNPDMGREVGIAIENGASRGHYKFYAEYSADSPGIYEISPIKVTIRDTGSSSDEITANAVTVEVYEDTPRDASGIVIAKVFPWQKLILTILIIALIAGLAAYLIKLRKASTGAPGIAIGGEKSFERAALEEIDAMEIPKSGENELVKEYYKKVDSILRKYLSERYKVDTVESTMWEVQKVLKSRQRMDRRTDGILRIMNDCNWVKYAKLHPTDHEIRDIPGRSREALTGSRT